MPKKYVFSALIFGGRGILATRAKLDAIDGTRALPAALVAYLLGG